MITHCIKHAIDLLILLSHTSHMLQPLDVSVFAPLKRALAKETDAVSKVNYGRISGWNGPRCTLAHVRMLSHCPILYPDGERQV